MTDLTFTQGDVETASRVLTASAARLAALGMPLWPVSSLTPERLTRQYPAHSWRVAWRDGVAVGTFTLLPEDPLFWPEAAPGEAFYLHKLGVHPEAQGRGLSALLLEDAVRETREAGVPLLRLDTAAGLPKLRALYEAAGFRAVDERHVRGFHVVRYELSV